MKTNFVKVVNSFLIKTKISHLKNNKHNLHPLHLAYLHNHPLQQNQFQLVLELWPVLN